MDDRGRLAQPLTGSAHSPLADRAAVRASSGRRGARTRFRIALALDRWSSRLEARLPRGIGIAATAVVMLASLACGVVDGDHLAPVIAAVKETRDRIGNAAGFRIVSIALTGNHHVSREEVLAVAGITGTTSLVFLDVDRARERLKAHQWIGDATVLKLYPGELQVGIKEREPFALWQKDGRVSVIADDGTVLEPYVAPRLIRLPLVVGQGAETRARDFLALLDRYPALRDFVQASVLGGERRWNLRLRNGIDALRPEAEAAPALARLTAPDRDHSLTPRDIVTIDLRLPALVPVRLSDAAPRARLEALKDKPKKKGGNA